VRLIQGLSDALGRGEHDDRALKICVVTSEILGPVKNGGIGTATSGIVEHLLDGRHELTVLFTSVEFGRPACEERDWLYWVAAWADRNVELAHIAHDGDYRMWRRKSWLVKEFLDKRDFDAVFFNEHHGSGYYALAAKRAGIPRFMHRTHCVITHGSIEWVFDVNEQYIGRPSDVEMMGLERRSVEWADVVIGPSEYLLRKYEGYGWTLPERTYVQPYPFRFAEVEPRSARGDVRELVFFGRLETRKGLWLFCEALDRISERLRDHVVTFMGRMTETGGVPSAALILERASRWPFQIRLLTQLNQSDALDYLKQPGRLAVMPSLADNSPCVVYECLSGGIPFVTTSGTGADELVHPDCSHDVMVAPTVDALSSRLCRVLDEGAAPGRPRFDPAKNLQTWSALAGWLGSLRPSATTTDYHVSSLGEAPVLLTTLDRSDNSISGTADRIVLHATRYGGSIQQLVLTPRMGHAREMLAETIRSSLSGTKADLRISGPESLDSALEAILSAEVALFTDAEHEILPHFFVSAIGALAQRRAAAVSCVAAERPDPDGPPSIAELPCGDLPAAGGLGLPIGSSVWAVLGEEIRELLTSDAIYRDESGDFVDASDLGQAVMHRLILSGKDVHLLPSVGAIRRRTRGGFRQRQHWYWEAKDTARNLGIDPSVQKGGPAWIGMNIARQDRRPDPDVIAGLNLPPQHPLSLADQSDRSQRGLSELAAAMGRPDQALRLGPAWSSDPLPAISILDLAQRADELRRRIDLLSLLIEQRSDLPPHSAGRHVLRGEDLRDKLLAAMARRRSGSTRQDAKVQVHSNSDMVGSSAGEHELVDQTFPRASQASPRAFSDDLEAGHAKGDRTVSLQSSRVMPSGRLTFIDVPLAGHRRIVCHLVVAEPLRARVSLSVIDQLTGGVIAGASSQVSEDGAATLTVDPMGLFQLATVSLVIEAEDGTPQTLLRFNLNKFIID
jgi:glycosyltransferase involved in cell wall biosynthesis